MKTFPSDTSPSSSLFSPTPSMSSLPSLIFSNEESSSHDLERRYQRWRQSPSPENFLELLFKITERGSTIQQEVYCGILSFVTVASVLAVNPSLLVSAGYNKDDVTSATALFAGIACIASGIISNLVCILCKIL